MRENIPATDAKIFGCSSENSRDLAKTPERVSTMCARKIAQKVRLIV